MVNGLIPRRYAKALYKFAAGSDNTSRVYDEMKTVVAAFEANPGMQKVLANPFVPRADKESILVSAAGKDAENDYRGFVKLILDQHREEFALLMALAYRDLYRRKNNILQVRISTAAELDATEMEKIRSLVARSFKGSTLEFSYVVDPALIGGFIIDVDSVRMDASVSNELEQLRLNLLRSN
jgi:ATP synthase F1, delta subunit